MRRDCCRDIARKLAIPSQRGMRVSETHASLSFALPPELADAIAAQAAEIVLDRIADGRDALAASPYMTVAEAADYLRCSRQRVDDLLSQRRLSRVKEGSRTLILRAEIEAYLVLHPRRQR